MENFIFCAVTESSSAKTFCQSVQKKQQEEKTEKKQTSLQLQSILRYMLTQKEASENNGYCNAFCVTHKLKKNWPFGTLSIAFVCQTSEKKQAYSNLRYE